MPQELNQYHQQKLLSAVEKMTADGVADNDIQAIVNDYKSRYGQNNSGPKDYFKSLQTFTSSLGFKPVDNPTGYRGKDKSGNPIFGGHNPGSLHYLGKAVDVDTDGKTEHEVNHFINQARSYGITVNDERTRPKGQAVWGGPHLHLSVDDAVGEKLKGQTFKSMMKESKKPAPSSKPVTTTEEFLANLGINKPAPAAPVAPAPKQAITELDKVISQHFSPEAFKRTERIASLPAQERTLKPGTIEHAMSMVDKYTDKKLSKQQRDTVKGFLIASGGKHYIRGEAIQYALQRAGEGDYTALVDKQNIVNQMPFYTNELLAGIGSKDNVVPKRNGEGYFTAKQAKELLAKAIGIPVSKLTDKKIVELVKETDIHSPSRFTDDEKLNPMDELYAKSIGALDDKGQFRDVSGLEMFARIPGAAFGLAPQILQEAAGQTFLDIPRGQTVGNKEVQDSEVGKAGSTIAGMAKYFTPAGPALIAADAGYVLGRANEVGLEKATQETVKGIIETSNPFGKNLSVTERIVRGVNAVLLGYGLTKNGVDAWNAGRRWNAAGELSDKLGIGKSKAYGLLKEAEIQAKDYIKTQKQIQKRTKGRLASDVTEAMTPKLKTKEAPGLDLRTQRSEDGSIDIFLEHKGKTLKVASAYDHPLQLLVNHIYLPEELRGKGLGTQVLMELNNYAKSMGQKLTIENAAPEIRNLIDALVRKGEIVTENPKPKSVNIITGEDLPSSEVNNSFTIENKHDSLWVDERLKEAKPFEATSEVPYPSAATGNEVDDLLAVLRGEKPVALIEPSNNLSDYLAEARKRGFAVQSMKGLKGEALIAVGKKPSDIKRLTSLYQQERLNNLVSDGTRSPDFLRAEAEILGHPEKKGDLQFSENYKIGNIDGEPTSNVSIIAKTADGEEITTFEGELTDSSLIYYSSDKGDKVSIDTLSKGLEQLILTAQREGRIFMTSQNLTKAEVAAIRKLEDRGYMFEWNPDTDSDSRGFFVKDGNAMNSQTPLVYLYDRVPENAKWKVERIEDPDDADITAELIDPDTGRLHSIIEGYIGGDTLSPTVNLNASTTANVKGIIAMAEWAKANDMLVESGPIGGRELQIWTKAIEEAGWKYDAETFDRPVIGGIERSPDSPARETEFTLDMNTVAGKGTDGVPPKAGIQDKWFEEYSSDPNTFAFTKDGKSGTSEFRAEANPLEGEVNPDYDPTVSFEDMVKAYMLFANKATEEGLRLVSRVSNAHPAEAAIYLELEKRGYKIISRKGEDETTYKVVDMPPDDFKTATDVDSGLDLKEMVFYHGSPKKWGGDKFDGSYIGANKGRTLGDGFYFTPDESVARNEYAEGVGTVIGAKLDISNPLVITSPKEIRDLLFEFRNTGNSYEMATKSAMTDGEALRQLGYDGVVHQRDGKIIEVVVFEDAQIKRQTAPESSSPEHLPEMVDSDKPVSKGVQEWLDNVEEEIEGSSQDFLEAAKLVDESGLQDKYKKDLLDRISYYGLKEPGEIQSAIVLAKLINKELMPYEVKADLLDFFQMKGLSPDEVNKHLAEARKDVKDGLVPYFLENLEGGMRGERNPKNKSKVFPDRRPERIQDLKLQVEDYEKSGVHPNPMGTPLEAAYARILKELNEIERDMAGPEADKSELENSQLEAPGSSSETLDTETPLQGPPKSEKKGYGNKNRKFKQTDIDQAFKDMMSEGPGMNIGPKKIKYLIKIAGYHAEASYHSFSDFMREIGGQLAKDGAGKDILDWVKEHGRSLYNLSYNMAGKKVKPDLNGHDIGQTLSWLKKSGYGKEKIGNTTVAETLEKLLADSDIGKLYTENGVNPNKAALSNDQKAVLGKLKETLIDNWIQAHQQRGKDRGRGIADDGNTTNIESAMGAVKALNKHLNPDSLANDRYVSETLKDLLFHGMKPENGKTRLGAVDVKDIFEDFTGRKLSDREAKSLNELAKKIESQYDELSDIKVAAFAERAKKLAEINQSIKKVQVMLDTALTNDGKELLNSLWKAGLIFTAKNFVQNIKGNSLNSLALTLSRPARAFFDRGISQATGVRTREGINLSRTAPHAIRSMVSKELLTDMWEIFAGDPVVSQKYGFTPGQTRNSLLDKGKVGKAYGGLLKGGDWLVNRAFGYVNAIDKPFYQLAFQRSVVEQAKLSANSKKLKGKDYTDHVNEFIENPTSGMKYQAMLDAEYAIFANKNKIADFINDAKKELKSSDSAIARNAGRGLDWLMPFVNIPTNVALRTAEWSPLGLADAARQLHTRHKRVKTEAALSHYEGKQSIFAKAPDRATAQKASDAFKTLPAQQRQDLIKKAWSEFGLQEQKQLADALGNSITGSTIMVLTGYLLYKKGSVKVNPYDADDESARNKSEAKNRIPGSLSIEVDDKTIDIDISASFLGRVMAIGATLAAMDDGEYANAQGETGAAEISNVLGTIVGEGLQSPVGDTITRVDKIMKNPLTELGKAAESVLSSTVPGAANELSRIGKGSKTPQTRKFEVDDFWNSAKGSIEDKNKAKIPGVRGTMAAKTDALGQKLNQSYGENVFGFKVESKNIVIDEILKYRASLSKPERAKQNDLKWGDPRKGVKDPRFDRTEPDYQDRISYVGFKMNEYLKQYFLSADWTGLDEKDKKVMLPKLLTNLRTGYNQEFDGLRYQNGYDATRKMVRDLIGDR